MFKKLGKNASSFSKGLIKGGDSKNKVSLKYRFDVQVVELDGLPDSVKKCRIQWSRNSKSKETDTKSVRNGIATFRQTLSQSVTIDLKNDNYVSKEYTFKVQVPRDGSESMVTVGKVDMDVSEFVDDAVNVQNARLPVNIKVGSGSKGLLKIVVTSTPMGEGDSQSMISGTSTVVTDQDLNGFDDNHSSTSSKRPGRRGDDDDDGGGSVQRNKAGSRRPKLPPTNEEEEEGEDPGAMFAKTKGGTAAAEPFNKRGGSTAKAASKQRPLPDNDDDDISPMSSDLEEEQRPSSVAKRIAGSSTSSSKPKGLMGLIQKKDDPQSSASVSRVAAPPVERDKVAEQEAYSADRAALFGAPAKSSSKSSGGAKGGAGKVVNLDEDSARNALFSAPARPPSKKPPAKPPADDIDESTTGNPLFSAPARPPAKKPTAKPPADEDSDEDTARNALFSAPVRPPARKPAAKPPPEDIDEDSARNALFSAPAKPGIKRPVTKPPPEDVDEDSARDALFSGQAKQTRKGRPPPPSESNSDGSGSSEEEAPPLRFKSKAGVAAAGVVVGAEAPAVTRGKPTTRPASSDDEDEDELGVVAPPKKSANGAARGAQSGQNPYDDVEADAGAGSNPFGDNAFGGGSKTPSNPFVDDNAYGRSTKKGAAVAATAGAGVGAAVGVAASRGIASKESNAEVEKLRDQVAQMQQQLDASAKRENMLNKDVETYQKQVRELEEKLDEAGDVDPTEMFAQMAEMEKSHTQIMEKQAKEHAKAVLALRTELEAAHAGQAGRLLAVDNEKAEEQLQQLREELEETRAEVEELREELSATKAELEGEREKVKEANKQIDESMMVATASSREKRRLTDEIEKLKAELEERGARIAAAEAYGKGAVRDNQAAAELHEEVSSLRGEVEDLQNEVADLQKVKKDLENEVMDLQKENKDLEKEVTDLQKQLAISASAAAAAGADAGAAAGRSRSRIPTASATPAAPSGTSMAKRSNARGTAPSEDWSVESADELGVGYPSAAAVAGAAGVGVAAGGAAALAAANKDKDRLELELAQSKKTVEDLLAQVAKLEAFCEEVENQGAAEAEELEQHIKKLERQLATTTAALEAAQQSAAGISRSQSSKSRQGPPQAESFMGADALELQDELWSTQQELQRVSKEKQTLARQLKEEEDVRLDLEEQLKEQLEDYGDDEALETVSAFESKYIRLRDRYKLLEQSSQDEIAAFSQKLLEAQQTINKLQKQVKELETGAAGGARSSRANAGASADLAAENDALIQKLVDTQMELGRMSELEAILRRDLSRAKMVNTKLAAQLTDAEGAKYVEEPSPKGKKGRK